MYYSRKNVTKNTIDELLRYIKVGRDDMTEGFLNYYTLKQLNKIGYGLMLIANVDFHRTEQIKKLCCLLDSELRQRKLNELGI